MRLITVLQTQYDPTERSCYYERPKEQGYSSLHSCDRDLPSIIFLLILLGHEFRRCQKHKQDGALLLESWRKPHGCYRLASCAYCVLVSGLVCNTYNCEICVSKAARLLR